MSHVVDIKLEVRDLDALKAACKRNGWTFREGQRTYKWWGRHMGDYPLPEGTTPEDLGKCDHAITVPGARYEIGVFRKADGRSHGLRWDFIDSGLREVMGGETAPKLLQSYGIELAKAQARRTGHRVNETTLADGSVKLTLTPTR